MEEVNAEQRQRMAYWIVGHTDCEFNLVQAQHMVDLAIEAFKEVGNQPKERGDFGTADAVQRAAEADLDMLKVGAIGDRAEEGRDINCNDALYLVRAVCKLMNPPQSTAQFFPQRRAPATSGFVQPVSETHTYIEGKRVDMETVTVKCEPANPEASQIKRYVNHDARKRWEADLDEWLEDEGKFGANRAQRAAFWFLLELKDAERIIAQLDAQVLSLSAERDEAVRLRGFALQETLDAQEAEKAAEARTVALLEALEHHHYGIYYLRFGCSCGWGTVNCEEAGGWKKWIEHIKQLAEAAIQAAKERKPGPAGGEAEGK